MASPRGHRHPAYQTMRFRIIAARGSACDYSCVDCGKQAKDWSYNRSGIEEYLAWHKPVSEYHLMSEDIYQYSPRCRPCRKNFDRKKRRSDGYTISRYNAQDRQQA
jgi:hypothetical protein